MSRVSTTEVPTASPDETYRLGWQQVALIVLFGGSLLWLNLGHTRVLTYHEVFFCQPAKEMLASGNWLVPTSAGAPCLHYPPGNAWCIAAVMAITGSTGEAAVRSVAVLSALASALVIAAMAARWLGRRIGLLAGLIQVTSLYVLQWGRLAESDMLLTALVAAAMASLAWATVDGPTGRCESRWPAWCFYLAITGAFFVKALLGLAFIGGACVAWLLVSRNTKVLRFALFVPGMVLFLLCALSWALAAYQQCPEYLTTQIRTHFGRFSGQIEDSKGLLFYFYWYLLEAAPWTPLAIYAAVRLVRERQYRQPIWQFLACWVVPGFTLMLASHFKSKQYVASLVTPMAILSAVGLADLVWQSRQASFRRFLAHFSLTVVGGTAAIVALTWLRPRGLEGAWLLATAATLAIASWHVCRYRRMPTGQLAAAFGGVWLVAAGALSWIMPNYDSYRDQTRFAERINARRDAGAPLYVVGLEDNQIYYYLDGPMVRIDSLDAFAEHPASRTAGACVLAAKSFQGRVAPSAEVLDACDSITKKMTPDDRLTLFRLSGRPVASRRENLTR